MSHPLPAARRDCTPRNASLLRTRLLHTRLLGIGLLGLLLALLPTPGATAQPAAGKRLVWLFGLGHSQIMTGDLPDYAHNATVPGAYALYYAQGQPFTHGPQANFSNDFSANPIGLLQETVNAGGDQSRATVGLPLGHLLKRFADEAAASGAYTGPDTDIGVTQFQSASASLHQLTKGGSHGTYQPMLKAMDRVKAWAQEQGYDTVEFHHFLVLGWRYDGATGGNDGQAPLWEDQLTAHLRDITADVKALTGQEDVYMFHDLSENWQHEDRTAAWFEAEPKAILVGTRYQFAYDDQIHLASTGTMNLGALYAYSVANSPVFGQAERPVLRMRSALRSGSRLSVSFTGGATALEALRGSDGYYNLRFYADGQAFEPASITASGGQVVAEDPRVSSAGALEVRLQRREVFDATHDKAVWGYVRDAREFDGWIYEQNDPAFDSRNYLAYGKRTATRSTGAGSPPDERPAGSVKLGGNTPNPFRGGTLIRYELPEEAPVWLAVYDLSGRLLRVLVDEVQRAGAYNVPFSADDLASGHYFYKLRAGGSLHAGRMSVAK